MTDISQFVDAQIAFAQAQLGKPYVFGTHGPKTFDCIGLDRADMRAAGIDATVFPAFSTVRDMAAWAAAHGCLKLASSGYVPKPGDYFIWGQANGDHHPVKGAGHTGLVIEAPSAAHPNGVAISAYNPDKGVITHGIAPKPGGHLGLYGFFVVNYPAPEAPTSPETPPPSDAVTPTPPPADPLAACQTALATAQSTAAAAITGRAAAEVKTNAAIADLAASEQENAGLKAKITAAQEALA